MKSSDYLIGHIREALAANPEVGTLDILVEIAGDTVYLSGSIDCESKRVAAGETASRIATDFNVVNELRVFQLSPVEPAEVLNDPSGSHR